MKKKNEIEQELDRKEFENEIGRDLNDQYNKLHVQEQLLKGKNKYVIAAMNFFITMVILEGFYWILKANVNYFSFGASLEIFALLDPFMHLLFLILSIISVVRKKSVVESIIDRWPF